MITKEMSILATTKSPQEYDRTRLASCREMTNGGKGHRVWRAGQHQLVGEAIGRSAQNGLEYSRGGKIAGCPSQTALQKSDHDLS
jgi:hypothetical protein